MKKNLPYLLAASILFILLLYWLLSRNISFIPSWNKGMFIATIIICSVLFITFLWSVYRSYLKPIKPVQWVYLFLLGILVGGLCFFGLAFARIDNKNTGLFASYAGTYTFSKISFHFYETSLMGTSTHVHYSRKGQIISHEISNLRFWNESDSIRIEQRGADFLIYSPKHRYLFRTKLGVAEELE